ncbi:MAG: hypothetical protein IPK87_13920 [Planctomycetes bacterium]|nr:hypothetical protein [Planctomycetota bacterium]
MDLSAVPYLLISRELGLGFSRERVFLCLCLIDHLVLGIGLSRDEAMGDMVAELEAKYDDGFQGDVELDRFKRN